MTRMLIYSDIFIYTKFLISTTLCKLQRSFTMLNLRKMEIAIKFNGNLGYICGIVADDGTVGNQMPKYYCCDVFKRD